MVASPRNHDLKSLNNSQL